MDFQISDIMEWFEENKDWLLIPVIVNIVVVLMGFVLMLVTGRDAHFVVKLIFSLLLFGSPFMGFYLGDYVDPYLSPLFDKVFKR